MAPLCQSHCGAADAVSAILEAAGEQQADLIAMPTAGHQGFLDVVRGSTSERLLRHAPCPVLAIPAGRPRRPRRIRLRLRENHPVIGLHAASLGRSYPYEDTRPPAKTLAG